jgi:uncharacterized coiled-coil protein SlyX
VGSTWDGLKRAEQEREEAVAAQSRALEQLSQDIAALRVTVHSLEDRVELEMGGLQDDLSQAIAKAGDLSASRERGLEERLINRLGWLAQASQRGERRLNLVTALVGLLALLLLLRC